MFGADLEGLAVVTLRVVEPAGGGGGHPQVVARLERVGVEREHGAEGGLGLLQPTGALQDVAVAEMEERQRVVDRERQLEEADRLGQVPRVAPDLAELGQGGDRVRVDRERPLDEPRGLGVAALEALDGGQIEQRVGVARVELERAFELPPRVVDLAVAQVDAAEVVVDLGRGLLVGSSGASGAFGRADVAERLQGAQVLRREPAVGLGDGRRRRRVVLRGRRLVASEVADRMVAAKLVLEDRLQHLARHVLGDGEAEVVQHRGRQVHDRGSGDLGAGPDVGARRQEDPGRLVVEMGPPDVDGPLAADPPVAALEAVIGEQEDGGLVEVDPGQHPPQQLVLVVVPGFDDPPVTGEAVVVDPRQPWLGVLHEQVRDAVDLLEIEHEEVEALLGQQRLGDRRITLGGDGVLLEEMNGIERVGSGEPRGVVHLGAVLLGRQVDEPADEVVAHLLLRRHQHAQPGVELGRVGLQAVVAATGRGAEAVVAEGVGDDQAVAHLLGRVGGPPADDPGAAPVGRQDVPDRPHLAVVAAHRHPGAVRLVDHEPRDAVLGGGLAGGDAGPDHRRQRDVGQGLDLAPGAALAQPGQVRHATRRDALFDQLPVGAVEAEDDRAGAEVLDRAGRRAGGGEDENEADENTVSRLSHQDSRVMIARPARRRRAPVSSSLEIFGGNGRAA